MSTRVLLIEDDAAAASLFCSFFLESYDVTVVDSLSAAIGIPADVILLDLRIRPDFDANSTLENMHVLKAPVIVLTNDVTEEMRVKAIAYGAVNYFRKIEVIPTPELLRNAIREICDRKES